MVEKDPPAKTRLARETSQSQSWSPNWVNVSAEIVVSCSMGGSPEMVPPPEVSTRVESSTTIPGLSSRSVPSHTLPHSEGLVSAPMTSAEPPTTVEPRVVRAAGGSKSTISRRTVTPRRRDAPE